MITSCRLQKVKTETQKALSVFSHFLLFIKDNTFKKWLEILKSERKPIKQKTTFFNTLKMSDKNKKR